MIKFALKNADLFDWLTARTLLRRFFVFRIDCLPNLTGDSMAEKLYRAFVAKGLPSRQTSAGRLKDLDEMTVDFLTDDWNFIHDVGVSSGITSVDLFLMLRDHRKSFKLTVSDKYSHYFCRGSHVRRIYSCDKVLMLAYLTCVLADGRCSWKFPISRMLFPLVRAFDCGTAPFEELTLYDNQLNARIRCGEISDLSYDVFTTHTPDKFTFVRCMNLLNPAYFDTDSIRHAISSLKSSLKERGVLLLGRTLADGTNTASFYRKVSGHFELLREVNGGCEIKYLLDNGMEADQSELAALQNP